ncbi:hypothetical protein EMGBS15_06090 [Filimonas sp.]|nr:hypothetical protein EMGBS15_06090 [Filimonas sp.]
MKTIKINTTKKAYAFFCGLLLSITGFSQEHVTMSLKNITATSNTIEFDLYIVNDGSTSLKLSACSYGVNFDPAILNGGIIKYAYTEDSREEALQGLTSFSLAKAKTIDVHQVRMTSMPSGYVHAAELIPEVPFKVGRFTMTNSVSWTPNSYPSFSFMETKKIGLTTTQIVAYKNSTNRLLALTPSAQTVSTQVDQSPILNPTQPQPVTTSVAQQATTENPENSGLMNNTQQVTVYPNPVMEEMTIDFTHERMGTVKIQITDLHGRLLRHVQANTVKGMNKLKIDLSELARGLYSLRVFDDAGMKYSQQFNKQ